MDPDAWDLTTVEGIVDAQDGARAIYHLLRESHAAWGCQKQYMGYYSELLRMEEMVQELEDEADLSS